MGWEIVWTILYPIDKLFKQPYTENYSTYCERAKKIMDEWVTN